VRVLTWAVRLAVFILLVAFAAKNVEPVTLRFYFDLAVQAPLVLVLFAFFLLGALFGITALLGTLFRQRREISALKRELAPSPPVPPMPPPI
jgi:lipopolysaccharide assembly protein A